MHARVVCILVRLSEYERNSSMIMYEVLYENQKKFEFYISSREELTISARRTIYPVAVEMIHHFSFEIPYAVRKLQIQ